MKTKERIKVGNVVRCVSCFYESECVSYLRVVKKTKINSTTIYKCINTFNNRIMEINESSITNVIKTIPIYVQRSILNENIYILKEIGMTSKSYINLYIPMNKKIEKNREVLIRNNKSTHILMLYSIDNENEKTYRVYVHYDNVVFVSKKNINGERKYYMKLIGAKLAQQHIITSNQCNE